MKLRKVSAALAATVITAGMLAGCSVTPAPEEESGPVELTFWSWLRNTDKVVEAFNESHENIQVKFEQIPGGADAITKVVNAARAGDAPDIFTVDYSVVSELATQGILQDISDLADEDIASSFPEGIASLVQFGGGTWSVPLDAGALQLFYRADRFEELGIDVPTTWDEYKTAAAAVIAADPNSRIGSSQALDTPALLSALAWQSGAQWASIDGEAWGLDLADEATVKAIDFQQELVDEGLVWTDPGNVLGQKAAAGTYLSLISGTWQAAGLATSFPDQAGLWRVAPVPTWDGKPASAMYGGSSYGITADSTHREAAYEFIKWMTQSPESIQARMGDGGASLLPAATGLIPTAAASYDPAFYGGQDIYAEAQASLESINPGWVWNPATSVTNTALLDAVNKWKASGGVLSDSLEAVTATTEANLTSRGIAVAD